LLIPQHATFAEEAPLNVEDIISQGSIELDHAVHRREAGMPIGNGVMGTLVWTTPHTLAMQINRTDVYASDGSSMSFPARHSDYGYGCGYVELDFYEFGTLAFDPKQTKQRLNIAEGSLTVSGRGVTCSVVAWHSRDVIAVQIRDIRKLPWPIAVRLRMLRPPTVVTRCHRAASRFIIEESRITLSQEFSEGGFRCSSSLSISAVGAATECRSLSESESALLIAPDSELLTVLISSSAAFASPDTPVELSISLIDEAVSTGFADIADDTKRWWKDFWERGYIHVENPDPAAKIIERHYHYFLYLMASSSRRGAYPPNFGGMLWSTEGDIRSWGVQQWWNNLSLYYRELFAANRLELLDPVFAMYSGMIESALAAARQQWDSEGIFIPETVWFNGLELLPDDIAAEMADIYLFRKPWATRSQRFREHARLKHPHSSRWNWKGPGSYESGVWTAPEKGDGPYGHVVHMLESNAKIAYLYWKRYQYTMDESWLRDRGYPMIRGVAEFFRTFPNLKKDRDGIYHIHHVNNSEGVLVARDTIEAVASMHGIFAVAIRASKILGVDEGVREKWQEVLDHLPNLPTSDHPDALMRNAPGEAPFWVCGLAPAVSAKEAIPITPLLHFDLCNLEQAASDPPMFDLGVATFDRRFPDPITDETPMHVMWGHALAAARLGRAQDWKQLALNQIDCKWAEQDFCYFDQTGRDSVLENRMTLREGVNALGAERLGNAAFAFQLAACQDAPAGPAGDPVVRLFPAWPEEWNASFKLRCRGGFVVQAAIHSAMITHVEVLSEVGAVLRIRNPWPGKAVRVECSGTPKREEGDLLVLPTSRGDRLRLVPIG
jgi:alpha-L-fucosidase 2